ncbi:MAG: hypothetical protein K0R19_3090 [Bacillota bacterium]|nr:hypothetical protein [Bacillota bacterium]
MKNSITEIAGLITRSFEENFEKMLTEKRDISAFIVQVKNTLDQVGTVLVAEALETMDLLVKSDSRRKQNWYVKEKAAPNTLATIFGEVHYHRTYYKHKTEKEYRYLSDELVGINSYDKMDVSLKAKLIEEAVDTPYSRSGRKAAEAIEISSQSVMNAIRELGPVKSSEVKVSRAKETVKILYIEADEDHVALQRGGCAEPKLVYVHEGRKQIGRDRWQLQNPRYFGGMYKESEELWNEVADYIDHAYDYDKIEKIYLSGDGASWIKSGATIVNKSIFVLDRYHLNKAVKTAGAHMENAEREIWRSIKREDKAYLKVVFETILDATEPETKAEAVKEAKTYILNHWGNLKYHNANDYWGCSAEGHISHIYSDRLSSRPLGWSREGVDQMARLRVFAANGGNLFDLVLRKKQERIRETRVIELDSKVCKKRMRKVSGETIDNLPALNSGKRTQLALALRGLRGI